MTLARDGGKLQRSRRGENQDGAVEQSLVLGRRTVVGNVEDRLNDDWNQVNN